MSARASGADRNTVARVIAAAQELGLAPASASAPEGAASLGAALGGAAGALVDYWAQCHSI